MRIKLTIDAGYWANSQEFPEDWQSEDNYNWFGYVDDIQKAWGMVMVGLLRWIPALEIKCIESRKSWEVINPAENYHDAKRRVVAKIEIVDDVLR